MWTFFLPYMSHLSMSLQGSRNTQQWLRRSKIKESEANVLSSKKGGPDIPPLPQPQPILRRITMESQEQLLRLLGQIRLKNWSVFSFGSQSKILTTKTNCGCCADVHPKGITQYVPCSSLKSPWLGGVRAERLQVPHLLGTPGHGQVCWHPFLCLSLLHLMSWLF